MTKKEKKLDSDVKVIARNRKARHSYFVDETIEAGVVLVGSEVKSLREGRLQLVDSYARYENGELWLVKAHISPYTHGTHENHEPERPRKLLLHKRQLRRLQAKTTAAGYTLIPLVLYFKGSNVKVELGLCRGKKLFDKREELRRKDHAREIERARRNKK